MAATVDYLVIFPRTDSFCDTPQGFLRLIQLDSRVSVTSGDVKYDGKSVCECRLVHGEVAGREQRYFQVSLIWPGDLKTPEPALTPFLGLLKSIRSSVNQAGGEVETLHDDLSAHYARVSYPLIHEIENRMRRLIANFMLVTVGRDWVSETLPHEVAEAVRKGRRADDSRDYLNVLYRVDFIHLGQFLFAPYSGGSVQELYAKLHSAKTVEDLTALQSRIPKSNWQRYFSAFVPCDDSYLRSRWEKLYELRCKVAHNALMTANDAVQIQKLIDELKPKIDAAIRTLPEVTVPREEVDAIAANVARGVHAVIGEFISLWHQIESVVAARLKYRGAPEVRNARGRDLLAYGLVSKENATLFDEMRNTRNEIVHGVAIDLPVELIQGYLGSLQMLLTSVEELGFVEQIDVLPESNRVEAVEQILEDTKHMLMDDEAFCSATAETNASDWDIDEITVCDIEFDGASGTCKARFSYKASGMADEARVFCGMVIEGEATALITDEGSVNFEDVYARVANDGDDNEDQ